MRILAQIQHLRGQLKEKEDAVAKTTKAVTVANAEKREVRVQPLRHSSTDHLTNNIAPPHIAI